MSDKQLTLKYRTLDQHVIYRGKTIEPDTPVDVPEEDEAIWKELVTLKVAVRDEEDVLAEEAVKAEPHPSEEPSPPEDDENPPTPKKASPKKKKSS